MCVCVCMYVCVCVYLIVDSAHIQLESIEMFGFGNWEDIANHVATKSMDECMKHYFDIYIDNNPELIPDMKRVRTEAQRAADDAKRAKQDEVEFLCMDQTVRTLKSSGSASRVDDAG